MSESTQAQRQERAFDLFGELVLTALRPLANPRDHKECFYKGLRLLAIDGTPSSDAGEAIIVRQLPKAAVRRLEAAFAEASLVCAVELGTHAPVAAAAAPASSGEQTVAKNLWTRLPSQSRVIADRLSGTASTLNEAMTATTARHVEFLIGVEAGVKGNIKGGIESRLPDGSAIVAVALNKGSKAAGHLTLREIHAGGVRLDGRDSGLRLWTTLLDHKRFPADEISEHYAVDWERNAVLPAAHAGHPQHSGSGQPYP